MNLNDRISKIINYTGLTSSEFADEIEVQRSSVSHITSGRNKPSLDFLIKVKDRFTELHWDWLIKGVGEMISQEEEIKEEVHASKESSPIPLSNLFAIVDDEQFGKEEISESTNNINKRDFPIPQQSPKQNNISDSQQLENINILEEKIESVPPILSALNYSQPEKKLKKILLLYDDGSFETYEQ